MFQRKFLLNSTVFDHQISDLIENPNIGSLKTYQ